MMLAKLRNNLLSRNALSVLGAGQYARYLATFALRLPDIVRCGDLRPVDEAMGGSSRQFHYRGRDFLFDCAFCDEHVKDGSFAFGLAREIYIRDCYLKWHNAALLDNLSTVIDLGANRGAFSALMAVLSQSVISVEARPQFHPVLRHNIDLNHPRRYGIDIAIVGSGAVLESQVVSPRLSMDELFEKHAVQEVDLLKMDIEGSEFDLFDTPAWLRDVRALSLEVHPQFGDSRLITARLSEYGFNYRLADESLSLITDSSKVTFIYAWIDR